MHSISGVGEGSTWPGWEIDVASGWLWVGARVGGIKTGWSEESSALNWALIPQPESNIRKGITSQRTFLMSLLYFCLIFHVFTRPSGKGEAAGLVIIY